MAASSKVAKNTFALILRETLNKGALFILLVFIGRLLGKEALGRYTLAIAISQIFFLGTELGLNVLVIREVAKEKLLAGKALLNIGILRVILGIVTMGLVGISTTVIGAKGEAAVVIYLCALSYFFVSISSLYAAIFRAFEKMELELFIVFIKAIVFLPVAMWMLFTGIGLIGIFNIFLVSNILALGIAHIIFVREIKTLKWEYDLNFLKKQLIETLPFWLSQLFGVAYLKLAPLLLFRLKGEAVVGLYNAGFVVVDGFWIVAGCFIASLFPVMSMLSSISLSAAKKEYLNGLRLILLIFLPLAGAFILTAGAIIPFFYGGKFIEIVPLFRILTIAAVLVALNTHNGLTIVAIGKQAFVPFANGAGLLVNFMLSLIFILKFSYIGAAYALIASEVCVLILMMVILKNFLLRPQIAK